MALSAGSLKCVKLLIEAGADVKGVGTVTPLVHAANKGLTDFYNCLLEAGADANVPDEAAKYCPDDATLYSSMSLCWLKMGQGDRALMDAQHCRMQRPGWAKAWFLEGAAQMLLKDYEKACDAFLDALKLDPTDAGTEKALWEAYNRMKSSRADK